MKKFLVLIIILFSINSYGQTPQELSKGYQALQAGDYNTAKSIFKKWSEKKSTYQSSAMFLLAKTEYRQGNYKAGFSTAYELVSKFPNSEYIGDAFYLMGKSAYQQKNYAKATKYWILVLEYSHNEYLRKKASVQVANALDFLITKREIKQLQGEMDGPIAQAILSIRVARNEITDGNYSYAKSILERYLSNNPSGKYAPVARDMLEEIKSKYKGGKRLGILLPLSGYNEEIGRELLKGFEFAKSEIDESIELEIFDQNESLLKTLKTVESLSNETNVMGLIGPIDNYTAAGVNIVSKYTDFPVFSPTAAEIGLALTSDFAFQLSPDYGVIATKLANYALNQLELKTFAILAPLDDKGVGLADAFKQAVLDGGGEILVEEWYYPESDSYKEQFMSIRRKAIFLTTKDTLLLKYPEFTDFQLDSIIKEEQKLYHEENPDDEVDSLEIAIKNIDGLFIPIYEADLSKMTAQYAFYNIKAVLLGNDGWLNKDFLRKNKAYFNEALFCTAYYMDEESWDYKNFKNRYRKTMKATPKFYNAIGYDIGNFIFRKLIQAKNRIDFKNLVSGAAPYNGIGLRIRFSEKPRVNVDVKMIKFKYGQFLNLE